MKNPFPVNLQTSAEVRQQGWQAESRDADGHLISCHAPIEADDQGIAEWIVECTGRGETVTFWPTTDKVAAVQPPPPSTHVEWSDWTVDDTDTAHQIMNYLGYGADASREPGADRRRDKIASMIRARIDAASAPAPSQHVAGDPVGLKPIPIEAAKRIAKAYGYDQVLIYGRRCHDTPEPHGEHMTTYGRTREHCDVAARIGDTLKKFMGWEV